MKTNDRPFVIAEIANCHEGCVSYVINLLKSIKNSNCDYVKFQIFQPEMLVTQNHEKYKSYVKKAFSLNEWKEIIAYCEKNSIKYFFFRIDDGNVKMKVKANSMEVTDGFDHRYIEDYKFKHIDMNKFPSYLNSQVSFKQYVLDNGGGIKPGGHPDEISHSIFANYLSDEIKRLYK